MKHFTCVKEFHLGNLKGRDHLEGLGVEQWITFEWI